MTEVINGVSKTYSYTYNEDNRLTSMTVDGVTVEYTYDTFGRLSEQETKLGDTVILTEQAGYNDTATTASAQVTSYNGYTYTYDKNGNILSVSDGTNTTTYVYDSQNQLIRENNQSQGYTHTWIYDNAGNILWRKEYAYTTGTLGAAKKTVEYQYNASAWGDMLTAYDGNTISYDGLGNPTRDGIWNYAWKHGRQLVSMSDGTTTWNYTYNADGLRTKRANGTDTYTYVYSGSQLAMMTKGNDTLHFTYDATGIPLAVKYNGTTYYYKTNLQGDIMAILDNTGMAVVSYTYDAWGVLLACTGTMADTLGTVNPLTYRGYVYDRETELYYIQSRYYDPEIGRWNSVDGQISGVGGEFVGYNQFAYCFNNPVNMDDPSGNWPKWLSGTLNVVSGFAQGALGASLGATVGWTGIGAVAAGFLILNGAATATQGIGQIVNAVTQSSVMCEDNIIRAGAQSIGYTIGGNEGATVAGMVYDTVVFMAASYAPTAKPVIQPPKTPVIGKMNDLNNVKLNKNEFKVADLLPDMGSPKANWKQNSSVLRRFMDGRPIRDVSPYPMTNAGFLGAERNLLINHGYVYRDGFWIMP